jgi:hypothetical protein
MYPVVGQQEQLEQQHIPGQDAEEEVHIISTQARQHRVLMVQQGMGIMESYVLSGQL